MLNTFSRLSPAIQEFIYNSGWEQLRPVQIEAINAILDMDDHIIISAPTASGKTEAAFLPILSKLQFERSGEKSLSEEFTSDIELLLDSDCAKRKLTSLSRLEPSVGGDVHIDPPNDCTAHVAGRRGRRPLQGVAGNPRSGFDMLYIAPLKTLINDQNERLGQLFEAMHIPIHHWHGDVSSSKKQRALRHPRGLLQITPESLECMLMTRRDHLSKIFGALKYVVIDEVHVFMDSDRGRALQCQLARLERLVGCKPRRIGLGATLSEEHGRKWLHPTESVRLIAPPPEKRQLRILVETSDDIAAAAFRATQNQTAIVFATSRAETEEIAAALTKTATERGDSVRKSSILVHHGSLSNTIRADVERRLKTEENLTVCATTTMELGIDIGQMSRIVQVGAPFSVSSFVQRLGRSGRRGKPPEMAIFVHAQEQLHTTLRVDPSVLNLNYELLRAIAIVELHLAENFIEPPKDKPLPFSLLFQQTLAILRSEGELIPSELARRVLTLPPFSCVTKEHFRILLSSMRQQDFVHLSDEGGLIVGEKGAILTENFKFYSTFEDSSDIVVHSPDGVVGTLSNFPPEGKTFVIGGRIWRAVEIDTDNKKVHAIPASGAAEALWKGEQVDIHPRVVEKMHDVLLSDSQVPYLLENARTELVQMRESVAAMDSDELLDIIESAVLPKPLPINDDFVPHKDKFDRYLPKSLLHETYIANKAQNDLLP